LGKPVSDLSPSIECVDARQRLIRPNGEVDDSDEVGQVENPCEFEHHPLRRAAAQTVTVGDDIAFDNGSTVSDKTCRVRRSPRSLDGHVNSCGTLKPLRQRRAEESCGSRVADEHADMES